jgi:hypothetical protein
MREPSLGLKLTSCSLVFASSKMLKMAEGSGALNLKYASTQFNAGWRGSESTLRLAHELGMPWSEAVVKGAARAGDVGKFS